MWNNVRQQALHLVSTQGSGATAEGGRGMTVLMFECPKISPAWQHTVPAHFVLVVGDSDQNVWFPGEKAITHSEPTNLSTECLVQVFGECSEDHHK